MIFPIAAICTSVLFSKNPISGFNELTQTKPSQSSVADKNSIKIPVHIVPAGYSSLYKAILADQIRMSSKPPIYMPGIPHNASNLRYGTLYWQGHSYVFAIGSISSRSKLWLDSNHDGKFGDDSQTSWVVSSSKRSGKDVTVGSGFARIDIEFQEKSVPCRVGVFDLITGTGKDKKEVVNAYSDFGFKGTAKIGDKSYPAFFQFPHLVSKELSETSGRMIIDQYEHLNRDIPENQFQLGVPFRIGDKAFKWSGISLKDGVISLAKSDSNVTAAKMPLSITAKAKAPDFNSLDLSGSMIHFPSDFKNQVVLLDFWATWDSTSLTEQKKLAALYLKYHSKGFEIIGISLDKANQDNEVKKFIADSKITWPQVYDGKFWKAQIAKLYGINTCPNQILVNGYTGEIIANQSGLTGDQLSNLLKRLLGPH